MKRIHRLRVLVLILTLLLAAALLGGAGWIWITGRAARRTDPAAQMYTPARLRQAMLPAGLLCIPWLGTAGAAGLLQGKTRPRRAALRPEAAERPRQKAGEMRPKAGETSRSDDPAASQTEAAAPRPKAAAFEAPAPERRLGVLRLALLLVALVLIGLGIWNGGMRDVLYKAIKICTECIGLG